MADETDAPDPTEADVPETNATDADVPESGTPEAHAIETDTPGTDAPGADTPDADAPETNATDAPDTDVPGIDTPEADVPEADATAPTGDATPAPEGAPIPRESLFEAPPMGEQERMVEAVLFAAAEPVGVAELTARMPHGSDPAEALVHLRKRYEGRGVRVVRVGDGWAIRTAPDLGFLMQKETVETRKLSRAAIETLAIIAYHQPVTRAEIEEIRGVSVSRGTVDQLLELEWIRFGRRKMTPGRPVTFVVTQGFLDHFGLESARDLPGLKELRSAGLLDSRPPPGLSGPGEGEGDEDEGDAGQSEMFEE